PDLEEYTAGRAVSLSGWYRRTGGKGFLRKVLGALTMFCLERWFLILLLAASLAGAQELEERPGSTTAGSGQKADQQVDSKNQFRLLPKPREDRDGGEFLTPGSDPENRIVWPFLRHLAQDQKQFWTAPTRLSTADAVALLPFSAFTGVLIASDSWISRQVPDKPDQLQRSLDISNYSVYSLVGASGGALLLGYFSKNDHLSETGLLAGEAAINSSGVNFLFKSITQRPRPTEGNGNGSFFQGGSSFPSEHSAIAWSMASVFAHEYP